MERWRCPECGFCVAADEDGCCVTCGSDCARMVILEAGRRGGRENARLLEAKVQAKAGKWVLLVEGKQPDVVVMPAADLERIIRERDEALDSLQRSVSVHRERPRYVVQTRGRLFATRHVVRDRWNRTDVMQSVVRARAEREAIRLNDHPMEIG